MAIRISIFPTLFVLQKGKLLTVWYISKFLKLVEYYNKAFCNNLPWRKVKDLNGILLIMKKGLLFEQIQQQKFDHVYYTVFYYTMLILKALL